MMTIQETMPPVLGSQADLLKSMVASYVAALVQREHIANKRLADLQFNASQHEAASYSDMRDRKNAVIESALGVSIGQANKDLGITPYPCPQNNTTIVNSEEPKPPSPKPKPPTAPPPVSDKAIQKAVGEAVDKVVGAIPATKVPTKQGMSGWTKAGIAGLLATMLPANAAMVYNLVKPVTPPIVEEDPTIGNVGIRVES